MKVDILGFWRTYSVYLQRLLKLSDLLRQKSFFLFGPRATGKTSLIREQLSANVLIINLLRSDMFLRLSADPSLLEEIIETRPNPDTIIVILVAWSNNKSRSACSHLDDDVATVADGMRA